MAARQWQAAAVSLCNPLHGAARILVLQKKSDMRHFKKLSRREVLRGLPRRGALKFTGGACPTFFTNAKLAENADKLGAVKIKMPFIP